jgi:hypothetical protein
MQLKTVKQQLGLTVLLALIASACQRSNEAPITGKRSDPPVTMQAVWQPGKRNFYGV